MNTQTASRWAEGDFGQGYATYARIRNKWYSVNGINPIVTDIRWEVTSPKLILALEAFCGDIDDSDE